MLELIGELADIVVDIVLHVPLVFWQTGTGIGRGSYLVRVGLALDMELVDGRRSNLKVLNDNAVRHGYIGCIDLWW